LRLASAVAGGSRSRESAPARLDLRGPEGAHGFLHSPGVILARNVAVVLAVVFWLGLAYWVFKDARRRISDPFLVVLATLLGLAPPCVGPVIYLLFRPAETIADVRAQRVEVQALEHQLGRSSLPACPVCSAAIEADYLGCPVCATVLRQPCVRCLAPLEPLWQMWPLLHAQIELTAADLDAALTAEAKTVSLVGENMPLVPQPESRAADL
jgi:hypothetical protein